MKPELTIIIPCYNCAETLEEAVASTTKQNVSPLEIVLVDDGSTDSTWTLMNKLKEKYSSTKIQIEVFQNEKNIGGGATRNRAVKESTGEVIFCLDSDDILPEDTMNKMLAYLKEKNADAVGVHKSIKFRGSDPSDIERVDTFSFVGEQIPKSSLLQRESVLCPLYSTFMIKKEVFVEIGGYPNSHGFDTQGIAWRFLLNNKIAYTCPDTTYLHRTHFQKTYYVREYESGKVNHNWLMIFEEFLYIFRKDIQKFILEFDVNSRENIMVELSNCSNVFIDEKRDRPSIFKSLNNHPDKLEGADLYWYIINIPTKIPEELIKRVLPFTLQYESASNRILRIIDDNCFSVDAMIRETLQSKSKKFNAFTLYGSKEPVYRKIIRKIKKYVFNRKKNS